MKWLQDMNWPGADVIRARLDAYRDDDSFRQAFQACMLEAIENDDEIWADNLDDVRR